MKPMMVKKKCEDGFDGIVRDTGEMEEILKVFNPPRNATDGRLKGKMKYDTIGKSQVHVPTHLYKVILAERENYHAREDEMDQYQMACFMMPNEAIAKKKPLIDYLMD